MELDKLQFVGCLLLLFVFGLLVTRHKTALFGLNLLNAFTVASATLTGFFAGTIFGQTPETFTPEHHDVISYSILGLLAMVVGINAAWTPRRVRGVAPRVADPLAGASHINEVTGWLTFAVGAVAELFVPLVGRTPTVSTAVHAMTALSTIGLSILLLTALRSHKWNKFAIAVVVFELLSIISSLASGFSFLRFRTILPLVAIWLVASGLTITNLLKLLLSAPPIAAAIFSASSAWFETRNMIRQGLLDGLPVLEKASTFFAEYWRHVGFPTADSIMSAIMFRVDMTEIFAAQVRYQPAIEPYANGGTLPGALYGLIPRVLWPSKPIIAGGSAFVEKFTGLHYGGDTSVGLPYPFELYANGGPLLVVLGLGVIGYVCGRMELRMIGHQKSLGSFWALALATAALTQGGERMDTVFPALVAAALTAYALGTLIEHHLLGRSVVWNGRTRVSGRKNSSGLEGVHARRARSVVN